MIYLLLILPIVGITQVIGALVRTGTCRDWQSAYGHGLRNYWIALLALASFLFIVFDERNPDELLAPMVFLSILLAIYYWYVIYFADRSNSAESM